MTGARTTDDTFTHVWDLGDGCKITFRADHGGGYVDLAIAALRFRKTTRLSEEAFTHHARRIGEVGSAIPATRRSA